MVVVREPPSRPKPLLRPNGRKISKKERKNHIIESINFYKERIEYLESTKPLIFKKAWKIEKSRVEKAISDLEYELLKFTNPEIIREIENEICTSKSV